MLSGSTCFQLGKFERVNASTHGAPGLSSLFGKTIFVISKKFGHFVAIPSIGSEKGGVEVFQAIAKSLASFVKDLPCISCQEGISEKATKFVCSQVLLSTLALEKLM